MADLKISQLTSATTPLAGTEVVPIVQSSTTKKVAVSAFSAYAPAFRATNNADQSLANGAWTKVSLQTETFDTNNCFDNATNYRFTPTVAGYYQFNAQGQINTTSPIGLRFYKNGSGYGGYSVSGSQAGALYGNGTLSDLIYMNGTTDYLELYAIQISGGSTNLNNGTASFSGALVRGA